MMDDARDEKALVEMSSTRPGDIKNVDSIQVEELEFADGFHDAVRLATEREHMLTFRQALHLYPASFFWAIAISFTIIMEGYDTYLLGNFYAYPSFAKRYGQYQADSGTWVIPANWQVALSDVGNIGNVVGLLLMGALTDRLGHRLVIMIGLIVMVALNFVTFFAPNVQVLTAAMALGGIPTGVFGILGSAYASEVCPLALRGFLTSFVNICWIIGQLVASGVLEALVGNPTEWSYRIPFAIEWAWPVPIFILAFFAPDSPWWCVRRGNLAAAERSLTRLSSGSTPTEIRQTLAMMVHTDRIEKAVKTDVSMWDCFKGTNLRRTEIACVVLAAQALSGESFAYGSTYFFTQAGLSSANSYKLNFGASAVAFVATCGSWILMIWFGRRTLILWGFSAMALALLLIGVLSFVNHQAATWTQAALTVVWLGLYSLTLGPQSFGLAAEVSATRLRSQTVSLARLTYQLASLVTNTVEPYLINPTAAGLKGKTAFVWFGISVLTIAWCAFRMPETKGITYTEMDILFEKRTPAWRFKQAKVDVVEESHHGDA
jgi:SP family general alpha glucoside:H+ symporter-like MFS transporter